MATAQLRQADLDEWDYERPAPLTLSRWQTQLFEDEHRFRTAICGRRAGKTTEDMVELARAAINKPKQNVGFWAPTWTMAKELMWEPLKDFIPRSYWKGKPSESDLILRLRNNSKIYLKSGEVPDRSRGPGWDFVVLDEFAFMPKFKYLWEMVLYPALADRQGRALFTSTPFGLNHAYEFYQKGATKDDLFWSSHRVSTLEGGRVPKAEVDHARKTLDPRKFKQEWEASFEALGGRVIHAFDHSVHVSDSVKDLGNEVYVGMDFNVNPMTACIASKAGDQLHVWDEIVLPDSNTEEMCQELARRFPDRTVWVCPDPSGRARKTAARGGETDFSIIEGFGFILDTANAAPSISDRFGATNAIFRTADRQVHAYVHPRCKHFIRALLGHVYKEDTNIPMKDGLDHAIAALGYLVWQQFNLFSIGSWQQFEVNYR